MKKLIKYGLTVVVLLAIVSGIFSFISAQNAPKKVKAVQPSRKDIETSVISTGKIQPKISYSLNFPTSGKVISLPFEEGDEVKKGAVLAMLESAETREQTNKAWADYKLTLEKIREFENNNKDKPKDDKYLISKGQLEAQRDSSSAIVGQTLATQRNRVLTSPIDGYITQINTKAGEISSLATPVITVADLHIFEFLAEIDEQDAGRIAIGQPAKVTLDSLPEKEIPGSITDISKVSKTNSSGGTYYATKISLLEYNEGVRSGMNGDATIQISKKDNVLTIPLEAVQEDDTTKYVYIAENGVVKKKVVQTGVSDDSDTEITSGLVETDRVITTEIENISEGAKVTVE